MSISSPDYWEGYIRKDVQCNICAKSNMQICCGDSLENKGTAETTYQLYILCLDLKYLIKKKKVLFHKIATISFKIRKKCAKEKPHLPIDLLKFPDPILHLENFINSILTVINKDREHCLKYLQ